MPKENFTYSKNHSGLLCYIVSDNDSPDLIKLTPMNGLSYRKRLMYNKTNKKYRQLFARFASSSFHNNDPIIHLLYCNSLFRALHSS